jgi:hypothetical protein
MTKIPQKGESPPETHARKLTIGQQITKLMQLLQRLPRDKATPELFNEIIKWSTDIPPSLRPEALTTAIAQAFSRTVPEIDAVLQPEQKRQEFDPLVPKEGWLHDYVEWTRTTEPPTVFHFFAAATVIGVALGRDVYFDKGAYQVFPNLCTVIVAPTGRCRKTSACNLAVGLLNKVGGNVLADLQTPEAMVDGLKTSVNAVGLLYAPELAVFLGRQKYQEGMVPLLTALFDCPKEWTSKTVGKGDRTLSNVALGALWCTTLDWMQRLPPDAFGGGFMSRLLFVVQENTPRSFPLPPPLDDVKRKDLVSRLSKIMKLKGVMTWADESAKAYYIRWYNSRDAVGHGEKQYAGYYERKPDHLIRLATILNAAGRQDFKITVADLDEALAIFTWMEQWLPKTFEELTSTISGEEQQRIMRILKNAGGSMDHSSLLRRVSNKMNKDQFKRAMDTLREAKLVEYEPVTRLYVLTAEGWK